MNGMELEVVELGGSIAPENLLVWDETRENPSLAFAMAQLQGTTRSRSASCARSTSRPTRTA